jgi:hypothetical protein
MRFEEIPDGHIFERHFATKSIEVFYKQSDIKSLMLECYIFNGGKTRGWIIREDNFDLPSIFTSRSREDDPLGNCVDHGPACEEIKAMIEYRI